MTLIDLEKARSAAGDEAKREQNPFGWKSFRQLWVDSLPDERWICRELEIGPGRPCGLWGFGSSGKTMYAMVLCLSVASGRLAFDHFDVQHGTASYVSHEMGSHACIERLRRLANGMLLEPSDLVRFKLSTYPDVMLNSKDAESVYSREFEHVNFAVLDSLRAALPGVDENKSEMAQYLELLARVSEKVGTTFLVLHHTSKDDVKSATDGTRRDKRLSGRGSSVIYDKSNSIWLLEGSGKKPRILTQIRNHDDGDGVSGTYSIELVYPAVPNPAFDSNRKPLRLQVIERQKIPEVSPMERIRGEIMAIVLKTPAISTNSITSRVTGRDAQKRTALKELENEGKIVRRSGPREANLYYPANGSDH
jgi:AAA domain-containing protein